MVSHSVITQTHKGEIIYFHFTDEETEAQLPKYLNTAALSLTTHALIQIQVIPKPFPSRGLLMQVAAQPGSVRKSTPFHS